MALATEGAGLGSESFIYQDNLNAILFRNLGEAFDNVIKPPDVREDEVLLCLLIRVPSNPLRIANDNPRNTQLVKFPNCLSYRRVDVVLA